MPKDPSTYNDRVLTSQPDARTATDRLTARVTDDQDRTEYRRVLSASTITGDRVVNQAGEDLGKINELMIDIESGRIAYAVLSFGGFLGMGDKLFAIPWNRLSVDEANRRIIFDVNKETLERAPGFDKDNWPNMSDPSWGTDIYNYYGSRPYWAERTGSDVTNDTAEMDEPDLTHRSRY